MYLHFIFINQICDMVLKYIQGKEEENRMLLRATFENIELRKLEPDCLDSSAV